MEPRRVAPGPLGPGPPVASGSAELVYHLAGALGTELQELARRFGPEAAAGLVPLVVRALELLEKAAVGPAPDSLQASAWQAELELRRLREENETLRRELGSGPREERQLLRQLKEVTDRQRDELRAHSRDLLQRSQETEALQEQLQRLLLVNAELRHKLAAVRTQLRVAEDREKEALESARRLAEEQRQEPKPATPAEPVRDAPQRLERLPETEQCGFSRKELEQILQERNELKANVFLLKEELAYFQRELLTDHRVPGLLVEAMKVAVKKQRRKIKAKMLGTPEEEESSDDEDGSWLVLSSDKEDYSSPAPGSRIQSFPSELQCCPGWRQKNQECTIPICEGPDACGKDEVCVKPGLCRCKPGFFGAQCSSRCPGQYWGPDCRETCPCHPWGQCEPATGMCQCQPDRWGRLCEFTCTCGPHGRCDAVTGSCRCDPGWWSSTCRRSCQCNPAARCDPATGACLCPLGWWGRRCNFRCNCHTSPCVQDSGRCTCLQGWWGHECKHRCECVRGHCSATSGQCTCPPGFQGARCELPCNPGHHGVQCSERCGHCKQNTTCSPVTGSCESCKPGWNGTQCKQSCLPGTFGESCSQECPRCRLGEPCHTETGQCQHCDPGWLGHKCENLCPSGTFGEGCSSTCPTCVQGTCDAVTGECVCSAGYWGTSCNSSCPSGFHGNNCSIPCQCPEGLCHPVSGACQLGRHGKNALIAGILVPLLLLLLGIACCACCRWVTRLDPKDRPARDGAALSRMKQQVWGALTSLGSALPCGSLSNYKLPWVTVSHHDPEVPFNHSFIEPPSAGWASDDSFSSDPDSGAEDEGHTYSVPPQEGMVPVAQEDSPEPSLPGGPFPPPEAEGTSTPFPIPRTSSLARAKRPSVSFAEGTKFTAQSCRSSGELSSPIRKPHRFSRGVQEAKESTDPEQTETDDDVPTASSTNEADISQHQVPPGGPAAAGCVDTCQSNTQESPGSVATIYMLAGTPQKPEGPVRSVFRRFGNFQKDQAEPKVKTAIPKPLRRALCRNQGSPGLSCGSASQSSGSPPSAMGSVGLRPEEASRRLGDGMENLETVQEPGSRSSPPPQGPQKQADEDGQEEPVYENVVLRSGPPQP